MNGVKLKLPDLDVLIFLKEREEPVSQIVIPENKPC